MTTNFRHLSLKNMKGDKGYIDRPINCQTASKLLASPLESKNAEAANKNAG